MGDKPAPPPEAVLIRIAREAAGLSITEAARRVSEISPDAQVSTARWSQIEQGYEIRAGRPRKVTAKPGMFAHMAAAVGLTSQRLQEEGVRPDATPVLAEIERSRKGARQEPDAAPEPPAADFSGSTMNAASAAIDALLAPILKQVRDEVEVAKRRARMRDPEAYPAGREVFPGDPLQAEAWDLSRPQPPAASDDDEAQAKYLEAWARYLEAEEARLTFAAFIRQKSQQSQVHPGRPSNAR